MADPFSIVASTISIVDVLVRLGRYLKAIHSDAAVIDDNIRDLQNEVESLQGVVTSVRATFESETDDSFSSQSESEDPMSSILTDPFQSPNAMHDDSVVGLWRQINKSLNHCLAGVSTLESVVQTICGEKNHKESSKLDNLRKARRKRSKADSIRQCRDHLTTYQKNLQILLTIINLKYGQASHEASTESFRQLSKELQDVNRSVNSGIDTLHDATPVPGSYEAQLDSATLSAYTDLKASVDSAATAIAAVSSNEYFDTPQPVSSIFTGRKQLLERIRNFWGVFWIDASTTETIKHTLSNIARLAERDPNENAALYWLSNIKQPWLLLIDNADDHSIPLEKYFPKGNRGHILVTTRNPAHKVHGNVGPGFFDFEKLEVNDANELLVRAAHPVHLRNFNVVQKITKALDFLALAITQAGAAINQGLCTLETYLPFYEKSWRSISQSRRNSDESPINRVYASWEANYTYLEASLTNHRADAIELLKVFAFLHREDIRFETFRRALNNSILERQQQDNSHGGDAETVSRKMTNWIRMLRNFYYLGFSAGSPAPLPRIIRKGQEGGTHNDYETELRYALRELVQTSLISYNESRDSYSMHPLQHRYARERLSVAERGLWAETAAMVLSASILLPPLGTDIVHQDFNRHLLPHLNHIIRCRADLEKTIIENQSSLWRRWIFPASSFTRHRAIMYAKFSVVYAQHGHWDEAAELQSAVKDYTYAMLGPEHSRSRAITVALSNTLWGLGRSEEAANMQEDVWHICIKTFGPQHLETLKAEDTFATSLWQRGRYTQAKSLQEEVLEGFLDRLGPDHEYTLKAKDNLGRTMDKFWKQDDLETAYRLHKQAVSGMEEVLGHDHHDTLWAKENLARVMVDLNVDDLEQAEILIKEVLDKRRATLGKEHPFTLLAMANTAFVQNACGRVKEAEELIRAGLNVANRNLAKDHVGILNGRNILGAILLQQKRYQEAEEILVDTTERQKHMKSHRGDYHPDRLVGLVELAKCYRLQGKIELSIQTCDEAIDGFDRISVEKHPLAQDLEEGRMRLVQYHDAILQGQTVDDDVTQPCSGRYRHWYLFW
ncbi:MAG: hypothetical protein Q9157_005893 [Trypethelium eluteriae]